MSEVDFFVKDFCEDTKHKLEVREKRGMYPPRFHVVISCSSSARQSQTRIEFKGATDLVFDIILTPDIPRKCLHFYSSSLGLKFCTCLSSSGARGVSISSPTSEKGGLAVLGCKIYLNT